jgi:hypothetical protein
MGKLTTKGVQKLVKESNHGMTNDGDGLYLKIGKGGGASWIYRFRWNGRLRDMGLGSYADKTLSNARESAAENRKLVKQGIDPLAVREQKNEKKKVRDCNGYPLRSTIYSIPPSQLAKCQACTSVGKHS